jgi:ATP-dependent RNA helicase CshB
MISFTEFKLQPFIMEALERINFKKPTLIQERVIPLVQQGKSIIAQSFTGTGKTHAFLLPLINNIDPDQEHVQIVIATPSRELATQIFDFTTKITTVSPQKIKVVNLIGGTDKARQIKRLQHQQPQIVIGTPGRILDLIKSQALFVHQAQTFVLDEADMTMDLGFLPEIDQIASHFCSKIQILVFSATIPQRLQPFLRKYLENPVIEKIDAPQVINPNVDNWLISTKGQDPNKLIYQLLKKQDPYLALIFANTKEKVNQVSQYLKENGLKIATIHGDIAPRERKRVMKQINRLEYQYVVATDLAARGIDLEGVSHIYNVEIPTELDFFIHRVGRTGRNNLSGIAITFFTPGDEEKISRLESLGIVFQPKNIKHGEIVASFDRNRRKQRIKSSAPLDKELIGLIKKKKKKIKPAYKKKIKLSINESNKQKRKIAKRLEARAKRTARKQVF